MSNSTNILFLPLIFLSVWTSCSGLALFALRRRQEAIALSVKYIVLPAVFPAFWSIAIFSRTADTRLAAWYLLLGCLLFLLAYDDFAYRSILTVDLLALAGLIGVEVLVWQTPVMTSRLIMVALALVIILPVLYFYPQGFGEGDGWVIGLSAFLCGAGFYPRVFLISIILALLQGIIDSIWVGAVSRKPVPLVSWLAIGLLVGLLIWPDALLNFI